MTRIATALLLGVVLFSPGLAHAEEARSLEEIAVETAKTPADHATLADYYRAKAGKARAAARRHDQMGAAYGRGKQRSGPAGAHCKRLSESYRAMASEYDELAKLHDAEAKTAE